MDTSIFLKFIKKFSTQFLLAGMFVFTYIPTLVWMWERWFAADSYYSHGILIPFVSMYLIWQRRTTLFAIEPSRAKGGMPLIIFGIAVHLLSSLFRVYFTSGFSMLIVVTGLVLHFYGWKTLRCIWFPLVFLVFMVPIPLVVIANISFKMKLFAAQIATAALNNAGLPAIREGSIIRMQHAYVIVDDVCSGLRSLISLTALGSIFAYEMKSSVSKRILLFLSTIPIAIVTNVVRVVFLASVSEIWGSQYAAGFTHDVSGFAVFALAFLLLYAVGKLLE